MRFVFASLAVLLLAPPVLPPRTGGGTSAKPEASAPGAPVRVEIGQFNDRRGGSFAQLRFGLLLPDIPGSSVLAERVVLKTAVDDTGRDLRGEAGKETGFTLNERGFFGGKEPGAKPVPA